MPATPETVLAFWFGAPGSALETSQRQRALWFGKSAETDRAVSVQYGKLLTDARSGRLDDWADTPRGCLAQVIVLDQFPHHVFRGQAAAFASDAQALKLSLAALAAGDDRALSLIERVFLYLPLEHAESLAMQDCAVALYAALVRECAADERALFEDFHDYAVRHRDVIARFGRFPHRNAALGRASTAEEIAFLAQPGSRF
ncbi:MAG: DUF924 domain-containing protein [Thiobacillus sp.]|nr:DUF924 domain-containing protein [Thiobacillus sp.]